MATTTYRQAQIKACQLLCNSEEQQTYLREAAQELGVSEPCLQHADYLYRRFLGQTLNITIHPKRSMLACIYLAAVQYSEYVQIQELTRHFGVTSPTLHIAYRQVLEVLTPLFPELEGVETMRRAAIRETYSEVMKKKGGE